MSRLEMVQAMDALWAELSKVDADVESPDWHERVLQETSSRVAAGLEPQIDWEVAKQNLRKRFE